MVYIFLVILIIIIALLALLNSFYRIREIFKNELTNIINSTNHRKWIVGGMMGSGKTTFAHSLSKSIKIKHIEIDHYKSEEEILNAISKASEDGWVAEANPWQIPDSLSMQADVVIFLDYDNIVNYIRLLIRGLKQWRSNNYSLSSFKRVIIDYTILDLGRIVFMHGKDNRAGWRQNGLLNNLDSSISKKIRCISPAELRMLEEIIKNNCNT